MSDIQAIEALLQDYFTTLHTGDLNDIKRLFLPTCDLTNVQDDGTIAHMSYEDYLTAVKNRPSPQSAGYPVYGQILSIDQSGPRTAMAKVDCAVQPRYFIDYLTLAKTPDGWRIAAKVFYVTKVEE